MGMHSNTIYKDLFFFWVAFRHTKNTCLDSLKANEVCAAEVQGFKVQKKQTIRKKNVSVIERHHCTVHDGTLSFYMLYTLVDARKSRMSFRSSIATWSPFRLKFVFEVASGRSVVRESLFWP